MGRVRATEFVEGVSDAGAPEQNLLAGPPAAGRLCRWSGCLESEGHQQKTPKIIAGGDVRSRTPTARTNERTAPLVRASAAPGQQIMVAGLPSVYSGIAFLNSSQSSRYLLKLFVVHCFLPGLIRLCGEEEVMAGPSGQDTAIRVLSICGTFLVGRPSAGGGFCAQGRVMIGLIGGYKKLRRYLPFRSGFAGLILMVFAATLGSACLPVMQSGELLSQAKKDVAAATDSHTPHTEFVGDQSVQVEAGHTANGTSPEPRHTCCPPGHPVEELEATEIRPLDPITGAGFPRFLVDVSIDDTGAVPGSDTKAAIPRPPSLIAISISRT